MKRTLEEIEKMLKLIELNFEKCPWVKKQSIESYKKELISEVEELKEALKNNDDENLREEMGDVLWDILVFIFLVEKKKGIKPEETIRDIIEKIKRRKPYLFSDNIKAETSEQAVKIWKGIKEKEKQEKGE